jgi:hypothetical protein
MPFATFTATPAGKPNCPKTEVRSPTMVSVSGVILSNKLSIFLVKFVSNA